MRSTLARFLQGLLFTALAAPTAAGDGKDGNLFIENDTNRIGVDLESGGSIFHFSEVATSRNLLNHFDRGRFIQQSFYGEEDGSVWGEQPWRWNPVQGGDYRGNPARLLDHTHTPTAIRTRSVPMNWAGGEEVTDCLME